METKNIIFELRTRKGLSQDELAEKVMVTRQAVSRWENGNGFPEVSLLLPLCNELEITVNELLSGERVSEEDYRKKAEENMVNLVREAQESKKKIYYQLWLQVLQLLQRFRYFCCQDCLRWKFGRGFCLLL